jgi:hypothetical protein
MNYNISSKSKINSISSGISSGTSNGGAITSNRGFSSSSNIGILLVIILSAILVAVKPDYFKYLFKTILGNLLLIVVIIIISLVDIKWGIGIAAVSFIIYQAFQISCIQKEGFSSNKYKQNNDKQNNDKQDNSGKGLGVKKNKYTWGLFPEGYPIPKNKIWPKNLIADFINFQKSHNPNIRFDLDIIQKQATAEEVKTLLKTGQWPWSKHVIDLYKDSVTHNNIINNEAGASLISARSIYNQRAILDLLSWNTKEGSFLLSGSVIGHTEGLPENMNNIIRCGKDKSTGKISMQKIVQSGYDGIDGHIIKKVTNINNSDIPKEVHGFKFLKGECNPCGPLSDPADYSCPFSLDVGNGAEVSSSWQQLWGISSKASSSNGLKKTNNLNPENISAIINNTNKEEFPILSQLRDELMKGISFIDCSIKTPNSNTNINTNTKTNTNVSEQKNYIMKPRENGITNISHNHDKKKIYYGTKNAF